MHHENGRHISPNKMQIDKSNFLVKTRAFLHDCMKFSDKAGRSTGIVSTRQITGLQKKPNNQGHVACMINLESVSWASKEI